MLFVHPAAHEWRAMKSAPVSVLASNESEHAHVRAVVMAGSH